MLFLMHSVKQRVSLECKLHIILGFVSPIDRTISNYKEPEAGDDRYVCFCVFTIYTVPSVLRTLRIQRLLFLVQTPGSFMYHQRHHVGHPKQQRPHHYHKPHYPKQQIAHHKALDRCPFLPEKRQRLTMSVM